MSQNAIRAIIPLLNFDSDSEKIVLGEGKSILRMSYKELKEAAPEMKSGISALTDLLDMKYVLEVIPSTHDAMSWFEDATRYPVNLIRALRLFKKGAVYAPYKFFSHSFNLRLSVPTHGIDTVSVPSVEYTPYTEAFGVPYILNASESNELLAFSKTVTDPNFASSIHVKKAMTRFFRSYSEKEPEDKIIDYCIAFESLFCRGEGAKGIVISTEASKLLGKDNSEREQIREYLRKAYRVRNFTIHRSIPLVDSLKKQKINDDPETFTYKVEDYLRLCIRKFS